MGADILKLYTSYRGDRFQVPTHLTTVTRQTGEYKVDVTRHPKFPLAFGKLASGGFPHCSGDKTPIAQVVVNPTTIRSRPPLFDF